MFFPSTLLAFLTLPVNAEVAGRLKSNVNYVRLFRHDCRLEGEDDYYLTTLENAVLFLHDIKASDLQL